MRFLKVLKLALLAALIAALLLPAAFAEAALKTGSYVAFGAYPQSEGGAEKQPILWRVLSAQDGRVYLLSDLVLDARPVEETGEYRGFESSALKTWLNEDFLALAFSPEEAQRLLPQDIGFLITLPSANDLRNEDYGFIREEDRAASATAYAVERGVETYRGGGASFWISDASQSSKDSQRRVMDKGSMGYSRAILKNIGVRPTILVNAEGLDLVSGEGSKDAPYHLAASGTYVPSTPTPQPSPTPVPVLAKRDFGSLQTEGFPPLTEEGFLPEGENEHIFIDAENGNWRYASQDWRVVIEKFKHEELGSNILLANLYVKDGAQGLHMVPHTPGELTVNRELYKGKPADIARDNNLVFSMDGDYYIYRVARNAKRAGYAIGIAIRAGEVVFDMPASESRSAYPPLDLLALYKNGDMKAFFATEITSAQLLVDGAHDVLSFGPVLIRDGELNTFHERLGNTPQPRAAIGMISPGHYVAVIIEGRITGSKGASVTQTAEYMKTLNCQVAFNLDGGWTSAMTFMGKQLNQLDNSGIHNNARTQNEVMGLGFTNAYTENKVP